MQVADSSMLRERPEWIAQPKKDHRCLFIIYTVVLVVKVKCSLTLPSYK